MSRTGDLKDAAVIFGLLYVASKVGSLIEWTGAHMPTIPEAYKHPFEKASLPKGTKMPGEGPLVEVPAVKTAMTPADVHTLIEQVVMERYPGDMPPNKIKLLWAQSSLETDAWSKMYHYNFGNVTTKTGNFFLLPKGDTPGHLHRYKVYNYPKQGMEDYLATIYRLLPTADQVLSTGNPDLYAQALKQGRYYEAPEASYASALKFRMKELGVA